MKNYGIVTKYDGNSGNIKGIDSIDYKFLNKDLVNKEEMFDDNKHVEFEPQIIEKPYFTFYRANYVKSLTKTNENERTR